jgi:hypothetical protein
MNNQAWRLAWILGLAGLIPFLASALGALAGPESWQGFAHGALLAYGAAILAFLGAVHWGIALRAPAEEQGFAAARLGLGVLPALAGWAAMLLPEGASIAMLVTGFLATAAAEQWAMLRGLLPRNYMLLRWVLTAGVVASLLAAS